MPTHRCDFYCVDKESNRYRKCKNKKNYNIINCKYCTTHYKLLYINYIILIQSVFRANKVRTKLNNIYLKLPDDLQRLIISKGREYLNYFNFKKTINNIINKKFKNILNNIYSKHILVFPRYDFSVFPPEYLNLVYNLSLLLNKYNNIYKFNNNNIDFYKIIKTLISYSISDLYYIEFMKYNNLYKELKYYY